MTSIPDLKHIGIRHDNIPTLDLDRLPDPHPGALPTRAILILNEIMQRHRQQINPNMIRLQVFHHKMAFHP